MADGRVREEQSSLLEVPKRHLPVLSAIVGAVFVIVVVVATVNTALLGDEVTCVESIVYLWKNLTSLLNEYLSGVVFFLGGFEGAYMGIVKKLIQEGERRGERKGQQDALQLAIAKLEENNMGDSVVYEELSRMLTGKKKEGRGT